MSNKTTAPRCPVCIYRQNSLGAVVYISCVTDIFPVEVDILIFRYFDADGTQLTNEQLKSMRIVTPAMEHIFATVADRVGKSWMQPDKLENDELK